jgi:hypothetical protein
MLVEVASPLVLTCERTRLDSEVSSTRLSEYMLKDSEVMIDLLMTGEGRAGDDDVQAWARSGR